jgi:hypothetical protein
MSIVGKISTIMRLTEMKPMSMMSMAAIAIV